MEAVIRTIKFSGTQSTLITSKNTTVDQYKNKQGGTKSPQLFSGLGLNVRHRTLTTQSEKALNMIKQCLCRLGARDINLGFKLFDSMVSPILYYGAEVWGMSKVKDDDIGP